jgi:hypothetical protein
LHMRPDLQAIPGLQAMGLRVTELAPVN